MSQWESRIVDRRTVEPSKLKASANNWRVHDDAQRSAMESILESVGWVQDVIVNFRTNTVLDGHMRVDLAIERDELVPVVYVDLDPDEEALVLATFDRVGSMASVDEAALSKLLKQVADEDAAVLRALSLIPAEPVVVHDFGADTEWPPSPVEIELPGADTAYNDDDNSDEGDEVTPTKGSTSEPPSSERQMVLLLTLEDRERIVQAIDLVHQWIDPTMTAGAAISRAVEEFVNAFQDGEPGRG